VEERTSESGDSEQRLERQILTPESEETTAVLRRGVAERVADLDGATRERLDPLLAPEAPQVADVAEILARLPIRILADRLPELPQALLRAIFEGLQLSATYLPDTHEADIRIVLTDDGTAWHGTTFRRSDLCPREERKHGQLLTHLLGHRGWLLPEPLESERGHTVQTAHLQS
jgi:hypothetical protein